MCSSESIHKGKFLRRGESTGAGLMEDPIALEKYSLGGQGRGNGAILDAVRSVDYLAIDSHITEV